MTTTLLDKVKPKSRVPEAVSCFIKKTYELLEDQKFPDIVDWNSEGTAIVIKKPTEFGQKVLPTYFKHNNITSFVRQLNMYDFHKRRTQKYDHVYYHDLFQRDKKQLLSEIRRKNQESTLASIQKAIETLETNQGGSKSEGTANSYENQLLKKLNKDALARIATLENKVKDLTIQNQALYNQITLQTQKEDVLVSFLATFMKKKGITLDQLPKVLHNQFNIPSIHFESKEKLLDKDISGLKQENEPVSVHDFFNFTENLSNSTEISPASPLSKDYTADSERKFGYNDGLLLGQDYDDETKCKSEFSKDYSVLPRSVDNWKTFNDISEKVGNSFLGKRSYETEKREQWAIQKLMKKDQFMIFHEGNSFMTNEPKEELEDMRVKKLDSFIEMFGNTTEHHNNYSIDLMNFS